MDKNGRVRLFYQIMKEVFDKKDGNAAYCKP